MQPIEITQLVNGKPSRCWCRRCAKLVALVPGPDIIVGDLPDMVQVGQRGITGRPGGGDDFLQQWRSAGQLLRITRNKSSVLSAKFLSDERWRR